jgi:transcriptional regulator
MSVYQPPLFTARDAAATQQVIRDYPFATLITARAPEPQISHLPLLYHAAPMPRGELIGHMARANPHWRQFADGPTMAVFHGPHEYISPSWYAEPASAVPTWNYAVVHVHGRVELIEGRDDTLAVLNELVDRFESPRAAPWRLQLKGRQLEAMVGAIVAFRMVIERLDTKLKLSQNRSPVDRQRVVDGLRAENTAIASATADWMQRYAGEP